MTEDVVSRIGAELKEARYKSGLSLENAAALANLSPEHLKEVEGGYRRPERSRIQGPTLVKLERIANAYGLRVVLVPR